MRRYDYVKLDQIASNRSQPSEVILETQVVSSNAVKTEDSILNSETSKKDIRENWKGRSRACSIQ